MPLQSSAFEVQTRYRHAWSYTQMRFGERPCALPGVLPSIGGPETIDTKYMRETWKTDRNFLEIERRSALGLIWIYNRLPEDIVSKVSVKKIQ